MPGSRRHARRASVVRRLVAVSVAAAVLAGAAIALAAINRQGSDAAERSSSPTPSVASPSSGGSPSPSAAPARPVRYHVLVTRFRFVDRHRVVAGVGSDESRTLPTIVWYPDTSTSPIGEAGPASFPLVVFAHGFDLFPSAYASLLHAWARAGYVVAAPIFPKTNPDALGGLDEADVVDQPEDVSFVITRLLHRSRASSGALSGLIERSEIAVAGHSDGGETVLAAAYDTCCRDRRIDAAVVMAGAQLSIAGGRYLRAFGPPLMAVQGTADTVNAPSQTTELYAASPAPKYLLWLHDADHLGPFTGVAPFEPVVERVTTEFLDGYLKGAARPIHVPPDARSAGVATLRTDVPAGGSTG